jgi:hypothetical protein
MTELHHAYDNNVRTEEPGQQWNIIADEKRSLKPL